MLIRPEEKADRAAVHAINVAAFDSPAEANLVDALRAEASPIVSLVAEEEEQVVGHIMFSPVTLSGHPNLKIMGLAPMAVTPGRQRQGIGSELVRTGLKQCRQLGFVACAVLGHPQYYPRFGFLPSVRFNIDSEYKVPDDVFMVMELAPNALSEMAGRVTYHSAFGSL